MIVKEASFDYSDPDALDAQIAALKTSGADVFMNLAVGRLATRAIRTAYEMGWHPLQFIPNASLSVAAFPGARGSGEVGGDHHQCALQELAQAAIEERPGGSRVSGMDEKI